MTLASRLSKVILLLAWLLALGSLLAISVFYAGDSEEFFGIADDQEQTIRFTTPIEIVRYGHVSGQQVMPGDLIVEVRQPDLDAELEIVQEKIHALKFGNRESKATMEAEIVQLQADLQGRLAELDSEIRDLRSRDVAAQSFLRGSDTTYKETPSLKKAIESLQLRKRALRRSSNSRIKDLSSRLDAVERPVDAQIAELVKRQEEILRRQKELSVHAQLEGQIGSVLFKVGDRVPPYQPVLTVHGSRPSFVKGYIHENVSNDVRLRQTVWVRSANSAHASKWHEGIVESLGSRIVEFPLRLKVNPMAQAWGREVVITINGDHSLLLGEKVNVQLNRPFSQFSDFKSLLAVVLP